MVCAYFAVSDYKKAIGVTAHESAKVTPSAALTQLPRSRKLESLSRGPALVAFGIQSATRGIFDPLHRHSQTFDTLRSHEYAGSVACGWPRHSEDGRYSQAEQSPGPVLAAVRSKQLKLPYCEFAVMCFFHSGAKRLAC